MNMCKIKEDELVFNTYYIFADEKKEVKDVIGLIFEDYLGNLQKHKK